MALTSTDLLQIFPVLFVLILSALCVCVYLVLQCIIICVLCVICVSLEQFYRHVLLLYNHIHLCPSCSTLGNGEDLSRSKENRGSSSPPPLPGPQRSALTEGPVCCLACSRHCVSCVYSHHFTDPWEPTLPFVNI